MVPPFHLPGDRLAAWSLWALALIFLAPFLPMAWYAVAAARRRRRIAARFHNRAQARGLSPAQSRLLLRLARRQGSREPLALLRSAARFDCCVHGNGRPVDPRAAQELNHVRAALGFDRLRPGDRLRTTRQLSRGHHLRTRDEINVAT